MLGVPQALALGLAVLFGDGELPYLSGAIAMHLARKHKSPAGHYLTKLSQNLYLVALRAFLEFLAERDIDTLPSSKVKLAKQTADDTSAFLDPKEIEAMIKLPDVTKPQGQRDRAIMETFFSSGMRISELVSLNVDQLAPCFPTPTTSTVRTRSQSSAKANDPARSSSLLSQRSGFARTSRRAATMRRPCL